MNTVPVIPESAPFTLEQRAWLNGYLAGLFSRGGVDPLTAGVAPGAAAAKAAPSLTPLTILFGSQTGNAEGLAKRVAKQAGKRGFAATVRDMANFTLTSLAHEKHVLVVASTYGEGEPPDNAKALHAALMTAAITNEPKLANLRYSVCALGDTNYVHFCKCGKDLDAAFEKLGATRVSPLVECDVEFEAKFTSWLDAALGALTNAGGMDAPAPSANSASEPRSAERVEASGAEVSDIATTGFSRQKPFPALVLASRNLNGEGSAKKVHHVEFDLAGSGLSYEAGDALGVYAHNCPELVADVLAAIGCDGEEAVPAPDGASIPLRRALTEFYDLGKPTPELLGRVLVPASVTGTADPRKAAPAHQVIDALLAAGGTPIPPADLVRMLKRLQPRLYSISSSPVAHAGRVHVTVGTVLYEKDGRRRKGVCSTFLADRVQPGETRIGVFVHANKSFRLPTNGETPVIMVGPGTGIAPFRGFLHERRATGVRGRNWLLFGDQRGATDFLYREELAELMREGVLTRLDTAFSRDQTEKIYVQQRMLENAGELYAWLEAGAYFYVCGDASRMAKDVDAALHRVVESAGGKTPEQAAEYVQQLRTAKRYQRDVY